MWCASATPTGASGLSGVLLIIAYVSAFIPHDDTFRYHVLTNRRPEACTMCYDEVCWELQVDRCKYYSEVNDLLDRGEAGGEGGEVDDLVYDMVAQAATSWMSQECVPFISQHTDCHKDNICLGCSTCNCNALGRWNCKAVKQCRPEPDLDVDHRVLVSVEEALRNNISRRKRSITKITEDAPRKISYAEIAEWMYGVKPEVKGDPETNEREISEVITKRTFDAEHTTQTDKINESETDYIEFDEVLKNIAVEHQKYKRRKPQLNETFYDFHDYMDFDESVEVKANETDKFMNNMNAIADAHRNTTEHVVEESTKVVIDLLVPSKQDEKINTLNYVDWGSNTIREGFYEDANDSLVYDSINIMKRDIASMTNSTTERMLSTTELMLSNTEIINNTQPIVELKNDVLTPLTKIIDDKQQELKDLMKIKDSLIQFINDYNATDSNVTLKSQEVINSTNTVLSIYNLDVFPELQFNLRKINPNSLDKLLYKLKRDIYEVIKDIVGVKKMATGKKLPNDLTSLIRAMSVYVHKQGNVTNIIKSGIKLEDDNSLRRQPDNAGNLISTKEYLIQILQVLDKDLPQTGALSSLSQNIKKILKRIIKNHYSDGFSAIGLGVYKPDYNMTNDLLNIGTKWDHITADIELGAPADKMYAMKLLHLSLSVDINKLEDAITLIDFAQSRRMIPIEGAKEDKLIDRINEGLQAIDDKIKVIIKYKSGTKVRSSLNPADTPSKRKSFINKIRNLLRGSKSDIVEMVNKKIPRSEIIKTVAKRRLDELARNKIIDYQNTMRKWQTTLNVIPRYKRSIDLNRNNNRMKNIIPKYLRGKLDPAIIAKKNKKRQNVQNTATLKKQTNTKHKKAAASDISTIKPRTKVQKHKNARNSKTTMKKRTKSGITKARPKSKKRNEKSSKKRH